MHHHYADIIDRISEDPKWWDENAVPRFCEFAPDATADIYCNEAVLLGIECQGCGQRFKVCMTASQTWRMVNEARGIPSKALSEQIHDKEIHFGDPPNTNCCAAGATMNSEPKRVLQYWRKDGLEWARDESLEIDVEPDWCKD